ncbi:Bax inhibitor-1 family protein [Gammaproteobacteria bacterium]|nr:Bax inhibitor-1 family protein [Gammaproteobacteria bacterium]
MNHMSLAFNSVRTSEKSVNIVLRNTYFLLSLCLMSCAAATYASVVTQAMPGFLTMIIGTYGLLYLVHKNADSGKGVLLSLAFSGFLGYTLGPIISHSLALPSGTFILFTSISTTGLVFLSLSAYVLQTRQDFSFMGGMVFVGFMVVFAAMMLNILMGGIPAMYLIISAFIAMLASASILLHTSMIINGGERNYILATVSLFVAIYNLFLSILQILMFFSGSSRD